MSAEEFEGLKRAESQRDVFMCLVENGEPMSSQEIAEKLNLTVNAVNIAQDLVDRVSRGSYKYKLGPILLTLLREYFEE